MPLFKIEKNKTSKLDTIQCLEKELQTLVENNLEEVLGIHFLQSEYPTTFGGRIDTLGIDKNGSPVIIEYKRSSNDSVINQALSYLKWVLDHKAEFERLVESKLQNTKIEIDWNSPRVICIAESYNKFDLDTVDILPLNIELLKYRIYDGLLLIDAEGYQKVNISTSGIFKKANKTEKSVSIQKEYVIDDLFKQNWKETRDIFEQLREHILTIDKNISEKLTKHYIAYKIENNFCEIVPQARGLWIHIDMPIEKINKNQLTIEDVSTVGHWATGDAKFYIQKKEEIPPVIDLINQSYRYNQ
jgi:predicted transport protein